METTQPKEYYSSRRALAIQVNPGKPTFNPSGAFVAVIGHKEAQFNPLGDYGHLVTNDPEVQAYLDSEIANGNTEIFGPAEYNRRITPAEVRARQAMDEVAALRAQLENNMRELSRKNDLLEKMQQQKGAASK